MAKDVAVNYEFTGECLEPGLVSDGVGAEGQRNSVLPTTQRII